MHSPLSPPGGGGGSYDPDFDLDEICNEWDPEVLQDSFIGFLLTAPIPMRIQFLSKSIFTTINLGLTSLSVGGNRRLYHLVTLLLEFINTKLAAEDSLTPSPHALGPNPPPHHLPPLPPTPSLITGFSPKELRDLFDNPNRTTMKAREFFADVLVGFPLLERLRVLSRALTITFELDATFSDPHDHAIAQSFLTFIHPRLSTSLRVLERVIPLLPTSVAAGMVFGPLTLEVYKALPRPPPSPPPPHRSPPRPMAPTPTPSSRSGRGPP